VAARNPHTRFIVYSRSRFAEKGGEETWVRDEEARLPVLRGRLSAPSVPGELGQPPAFRDPC
jgi:hypothetical protein